jgi:hypothetical protein
LGRHRAKPAPITWGIQQWIEEARGWPESAAKFERLRTLAGAAGDAGLAAEAERLLAERGASPTPRAAAREPVQLSRREYDGMVRRVCERVAASTPPGAMVAIASKGDATLMAIEGRRAKHFPQLDDGTYAGSYPHDDAEAVRQVQELRRRRVTHLVFPATALWWHTHYAGLARHLESHHGRILDEPETCVIYRLDDPAGTSSEADANRPADVARPAAALGLNGGSR